MVVVRNGVSLKAIKMRKNVLKLCKCDNSLTWHCPLLLQGISESHVSADVIQLGQAEASIDGHVVYNWQVLKS